MGRIQKQTSQGGWQALWFGAMSLLVYCLLVPWSPREKVRPSGGRRLCRANVMCGNQGKAPALEGSQHTKLANQGHRPILAIGQLVPVM